MDRGAWRAMVRRVTKNQTRLKRLSVHTQYMLHHLLTVSSHAKQGAFLGLFNRALIPLMRVPPL